MLNMKYKVWEHEVQDKIVAICFKGINAIGQAMGSLRNVDNKSETITIPEMEVESIDSIINRHMSAAWANYSVQHEISREEARYSLNKHIKELVNVLEDICSRELALEYIEAWIYRVEILEWADVNNASSLVSETKTDEHSYEIFTEDGKEFCLVVDDDFEVWFHSLYSAQYGALLYEYGADVIYGGNMTVDDICQITGMTEEEIDMISEESVEIVPGFSDFVERITKFINLGKVAYQFA